MGSSGNQSIFIAILGALVFVLVILLISVPSTTKKGNKYNPQNSGSLDNGFNVKIRPKDFYIFDGAEIEMRSLATGAHYKIQTKDNSCTGDNKFISNVFYVSPNYIDFEFGPATLSKDPKRFLLKKYEGTVKPPDLTTEEFERVKESYYIIYMGLSFGLNNININAYLYGNTTLQAFSLPESSITDAFISFTNYRILFNFKRVFPNDNLFIMETVLNPGFTFECSRHQYRIAKEFRTSNLTPTGPQGLLKETYNPTLLDQYEECLMMPERQYTDPVKSAFYITPIR